jgi:tetratricopeptide (TPR) repeat protein
MSDLFDRSQILNDIIFRLSVMQECLKWHSQRGENDACKTAEDVVARFLAALKGWNLVNLNTIKPNYPAADLGDKDERIAIQVTVNGTTEKIRETHAKAITHHLGDDFDRLFILFLLPKSPSDPQPSSTFTPCPKPAIESWARPQIDALLNDCHTGKLREILAVLKNEMSGITEILRPVAGPRPCNLPEAIGDFFIGRDDFLTALGKALTTTETTVIHSRQTIHGMGGVGKTRAGIEYAWANEGLYNALLFVTADFPDALDRNLAALCEPGVLDLPEHKLTETKVQLDAVLRWLQGHPGWFLLIDNADSPEAQDAVRKLTARIPHGHIVITSRRTDWPVNFSTLSLDVLDVPSSIRLLFKHTEGRRTPSPDDDACAAKIAAHLDGLCFALEQAAAYIRKGRLTFAAYLAAWEASSVLLHEQYGDKGLGDYHETIPGVPRSLCVTYQTSLAKLSEPAQELFRILSWIAPDPMPVCAIEKIKSLPDPRSLLIELDDLSLARLSADNANCTVHRLLQEIARQQQTDAKPKELIAALEWLNWQCIGEPQDVNTWPVLVPLNPHAIAIATFAADRSIPQPSARLLSQAGILFTTQASYRVAEPLLIRALAMNEAVCGKNHPEVATCLSNLGALYVATNRPAEAEPLMRRALAIDEAHYGGRHFTLTFRLINLAELLRATNRSSEAEPLLRRALTIAEACYGRDHPLVAMTLNGLAVMLKEAERYEEAEPMMRRALAISETARGKEHPDVAMCLGNLAQLMQSTNRLAETEPLIRRCLAIHEAAYGKGHPDVATDLNNLGQLLKATHRLAEAEPLIRRALAIAENVYGKDHPHVAIALNNLARLLQAANRLDEAEPPMRRNLEILLRFTRDNRKEHPNLEASITNYGCLFEEMGDDEERIKEKFRAVMAPFGISI